jgi:hypothetical protein
LLAVSAVFDEPVSIRKLTGGQRMEEEKKDFVIKDRRIFSKEDQEGQEEKREKEEKTFEQKEAAQKEAAQKETPSAEEKQTEIQLPEINFHTFIFSLNASALVQLGVMEDPATGKKEKNLPLAKQTIDMLTMLQEKTAGNLTKEEEDMLKYVLYDLRIRYVKEKG